MDTQVRVQPRIGDKILFRLTCQWLITGVVMGFDDELVLVAFPEKGLGWKTFNFHNCHQTAVHAEDVTRIV